MKPKTNNHSFDVIIVGSGFGGSVCAARMAEKGMKVLVLERGPWWGPLNKDQPKKDRRKLPRGLWGARKYLRNIRKAQKGQTSEKIFNRDGLLEIHKFDHLTSVTSSGVGGGSQIYTSILEKPARDFFDAYPPEINAEEMDPYFERVRKMIRPAPIPDKPEKNRVFERAVAEAGLPRPEYPELAVVWGKDPRKPERIINASGVVQFSSTYQSDVFVGSSDGSKTTMDLTYIPLARQKGAELRPLCEVRYLDKTAKGYQVRYRDHRVKKDIRVEAPRVVLAAGCLNTLRLLFQARDKHRTLPNISENLGRQFSPNGDLSALVWRSRVLKDASYGSPFNAYTRLRHNGSYNYLVGEVGLPVHALPLLWPLNRWLKQSTYLFGMGRDASKGTIEFDGETLTTCISQSMDRELFTRIQQTIDEIAKGYQPKKIIRRKDLFTVHPMGGCSTGQDTSEGVTDHRGQVFNYPGLYVADGSLYPRSPGIAPSLTIAAMAERIAEIME